MTLDEAMQWTHPSNPSITQDLECARVLSAEVVRLQENWNKNHDNELLRLRSERDSFQSLAITAELEKLDMKERTEAAEAERDLYRDGIRQCYTIAQEHAYGWEAARAMREQFDLTLGALEVKP